MKLRLFNSNDTYAILKKSQEPSLQHRSPDLAHPDQRDL